MMRAKARRATRMRLDAHSLCHLYSFLSGSGAGSVAALPPRRCTARPVYDVVFRTLQVGDCSLDFESGQNRNTFRPQAGAQVGDLNESVREHDHVLPHSHRF